MNKKILKHDTLLELASRFEGIDESRFLNCALSQIDQVRELSEEKYYPVDVNRYHELSGAVLGQAYTELVKICEKYKTTTIEVDLTDGYTWCTSLIYDYTKNDELKTIFIRWNRKVIPFISGDMVHGRFAYYDPILDQIANHKVYLLTELIQRKSWNLRLYNKVIISMSEIRRFTRTEHSYLEYKDYNKRIIKPALEQIEDKLGYRLEAKKSRTSEEVTFILISKKQRRENELAQLEEEMPI